MATEEESNVGGGAGAADEEVERQLVMAMDLETTGFIRKGRYQPPPPPTVLHAYEQARVVQIGVALLDMDTGALVESHR